MCGQWLLVYDFAFIVIDCVCVCCSIFLFMFVCGSEYLDILQKGQRSQKVAKDIPKDHFLYFIGISFWEYEVSLKTYFAEHL